jgi:hypothetical protein
MGARKNVSTLFCFFRATNSKELGLKFYGRVGIVVQQVKIRKEKYSKHEFCKKTRGPESTKIEDFDFGNPRNVDTVKLVF